VGKLRVNVILMQETAERKIFELTISLSLLSHRRCYGGPNGFSNFTYDPVEHSSHSLCSFDWCVIRVSADINPFVPQIGISAW